jgi:hypothetical protein
MLFLYPDVSVFTNCVHSVDSYITIFNPLTYFDVCGPSAPLLTVVSYSDGCATSSDEHRNNLLFGQKFGDNFETFVSKYLNQIYAGTE